MAGHIAGKCHLMGYHQHGQAFSCQLLHNVKHLAYHLRVEGRGGLIKKQHLRLHGKGTGNGHTLFLTAGQLPRLCVHEGFHAYFSEVVDGVFMGLCLFLLCHLYLSDDTVFQHRHIVEQVKALEYHAHLCAVGRHIHLRIGDILSMEQNLSAAWFFQEIHTAEHCGFSGTGGSDDGNHVAPADFKINVLKHPMASEAFAQMGYF